MAEHITGEQHHFGGKLVPEKLQINQDCPVLDESQLVQHLNNIADFARCNDLDLFDDVNGGATAKN